MRKLSFFGAAALAVAAIAVPAEAAKPPRCVVHSSLYEVWGKLTAAGSLDVNTSEGGYEGTLTVFVTRTNVYARADLRKTRTYSVDRHTIVAFGRGVSKTAPAANGRVHLRGKITSMPKECKGFVPGISILRAELQVPKH